MKLCLLVSLPPPSSAASCSRMRPSCEEAGLNVLRSGEAICDPAEWLTSLVDVLRPVVFR